MRLRALLPAETGLPHAHNLPASHALPWLVTDMHLVLIAQHLVATTCDVIWPASQMPASISLLPAHTGLDVSTECMHRRQVRPALAVQDGPQEDEAGKPMVEADPVAWLQAQAWGNSLPSVLEWLPVPPHDLLLVLLLLPRPCPSPLAFWPVSVVSHLDYQCDSVSTFN